MAMNKLSHNGVLIPEPYRPQGFTIQFRGKSIALNALQEEMAVKFAQKFGTHYIEDKGFCSNFMKDFAKALSIKEKIGRDDFDWKPILQWLEQERQRKANMTKEERKAQAEERKRIRENNKARYGYAIVDGQRIELTNYVVEPPGIFLGRGLHPLRGRWKPAIQTKDVTLNLSPDAPTPPGDWGGRVWRPSEFWVAKWTDKLTRKVKYVWFHDASPMRQERAREKFELAEQLEVKIQEVRNHILRNLTSKDGKRRRVATVVYLIDVFHIRVGDEKETEAGTVGASSLRSEHLRFHNPTSVELRFLGKDSILFDRTVNVSQEAFNNLKEFAADGGPLFTGIRSNEIKLFLSEVMPKLSPKVFRTFSATQAFKKQLEVSGITSKSDEEDKRMALIKANAAVARLLNHQRTPQKRWGELYERRRATLHSLEGGRTKTAEMRRKKLRLRLEEMRLTKTWNLGTSLRNYIDPRVVVAFCRRVNYDCRAYYSKALADKFSWADS